MNRRSFLRGVGIAAAAVVGAGVWRAYDQGVFTTGGGRAYEPWGEWRAGAHAAPLDLVKAAILAASPHNTQPWRFRVGESRIELFADLQRNLGAMDPYLREMHLGLGCALENLVLAARAHNYAVQVTVEPGALSEAAKALQPSHVATVELTLANDSPSPLYAAIPGRHTNRGAYDMERPVPVDALDELRAMAAGDHEVGVILLTGDGERSKFADATVRATEAIVSDAEMAQDSHRWFRHRWSDVQEYSDGLTMDSSAIPAAVRVIGKMLPAPSEEAFHRFWVDDTREVHVAKAPVFGLIGVRNLYDRPQTLEAGRLWQRMHLWATTRGLAMQPINQIVEIVDRERQRGQEPQFGRILAELTGNPAWSPTFAFRMGYPTIEALPSPRRSVEEVLLS